MRNLFLFLLIGGFMTTTTVSVSIAADSGNNTDQNIAAISPQINHAKTSQLRNWLHNIKPAAGVKQTMSKNSENYYWKKTVARSRGRM